MKNNPADIITYLNTQLAKDRQEYKGDIPTQYNRGGMAWSDTGWLVTELMQFLQNDETTSYVLKKFGKKYTWVELAEILHKAYPNEWSDAADRLPEYILD